MIKKNLTPFHWGPKATSLQPPQIAMAICVRGVFKLQPGAPLEAIEDPLAQGFMSGDVWADDDPECLGDLVHSNDFADFKPRADLLLKGTCYPPGGGDVAAEVRFGVGDWSKALHVVGARTYKAGLLLGGSASEPKPFTHLPLTWAHAYGGEGYARNPAGKGYASAELPQIEYPGKSVTKKGAKRVTPAGFGPISPNWPQRIKKRGKNYGAKWKKTRAPWFSDDFDWTYFNAAPEDQQLDRYLRGDEQLVLQNLHPQVREWKAQLPGLRLRAFVKKADGTIHEPTLYLDTLLADTDAGRLYLTWRGHTPIGELDLSDVAATLIASEPLAEPALPRAHYEQILAEFEADPVGLKDAFPPGFIEVAQAIEAHELAVLNDQPPPDLRALAANLPAGCPFPPWMLLAVAGDADPLGIMANFPPGLLAAGAGHPNPLGAMAGRPELPTEAEIKEIARNIEAAKAAGNPPAMLDEVAKLERLLPPDKQPDFRAQLQSSKQSIEKAMRDSPESFAPDREPPPAAPPAAEQQAKLKANNEAILAARPADLAKLQAAPSVDQSVAKALAPLDQIQIPVVEPLESPVDVKALAAKLDADEAALRAKGISHPLLGLFDMGRRLIANSPKPSDFLPPDMSPLAEGLGKAHGALLGAGISLAALAPLKGLMAKLEAAQAKLPPRPPAPELAGYDEQDLSGHDFNGRDLRESSFRRARLARATFVGADLRGVDLSGADLTDADLSQAQLGGASLKEVTLLRARLVQANLVQANLEGAQGADAVLSGADLSGARLERAEFERAKLVGARLIEANLIEANLGEADLSGADLSRARLEATQAAGAVLQRARLEGAFLRFAILEQADLREAVLRGADLSLAQLDKVKADGVDLSETRLDMTSLKKARLCQANLSKAAGEMPDFVGSNLRGADLRGCRFTKADLGKANLEGADLSESVLLSTTFRDVQASGARFVKADLTGSATGGQASFLGAVFVGLKGRRSVWLGADLSGADFSHADLRDCNMLESRGQEVNFYAARLKGGFLRQTRFKRPVFVSADLCDADLTSATFVEARFNAANCYATKFLFSTLDACDFTQANLSGAMFDDPRPPLLGVR